MSFWNWLARLFKPQPKPPQVRGVGVLVLDHGLPVFDALVYLDDPNIGPYNGRTDSQGWYVFTSIRASLDLTKISVSGIPSKKPYSRVITLPPRNVNIVIGGPAAPTDISLPGLESIMPPVPTRDQVLSIQLTFQGLTVQTQQYGTLPWFEAALAWLNPTDRQSVYAAKHAAGDTHCIIHVPNGIPLYDAPGQPYNQMGPLDWTNGERYIDTLWFGTLVKEVITNGFTPMIFMDERQDHSMRIMPLVLRALQAETPDLTQYCIILPGWDGVFYGWDPNDIVAWATLARSIAPNCYLGLEHNTGHIPLGEGGEDYLPGGRMNGFDVILSELDDWPDEGGGDGTWQIVGRMVRPYHRPPDQPAGDDPNPPFYLAPESPRGPYYYCAFEFGYAEYLWVRGKITAEAIQNRRNRIKALGVKWTG